jgi:Tetratricopeptide repeat
MERARALGEDTLQRSRRVLGPDHSITLWVATALTGALQVDTAAYGPDHPKVATDLEALADVQERQDDSAAAAASRAEAQRIRDLQ